MYLIIIAIILLLGWLLLDGFVKSNPHIIANFLKKIKNYMLSALLLLLGIWLLFSGKAYLSWVGLFAFLPLLKRLALSAFYILGANFLRKKLSPMGARPNIRTTQYRITLQQAEKLLSISRDADESQIIEAYLAAKKKLSEIQKTEPDIYAEKTAQLTAARDKILFYHQQNRNS